MEKDGRFNFRLLVPPRVSAVKPQEIVDNRAELGPSKYFVKDQSNKSVAAPTQPTTPDCVKMTVAPAEKEESNCSPGQLCSKMFEEVEKIKFWKVKVDSDAAQSERKLQENKRTIETQRNAIQELQFQNESLSTKLEEQMSENEDWQNKHNATRDLCNLLKETLERSADKMQLFESERAETQHLLMENRERVQKVIAAFELLRGQAEAEREKMQSVKENLQKMEALKETYHQECTLKEKEVATLIAKLQDKESELEKVQRDLRDTQNQCRQLEEAKIQQCKDLRSSKMAQDSLLEKLHSAEQRYKESETSREVMGAMLRRSKEEHAQILQSKDLSLQEVHRVKNEQAEKVEQVQRTLVELQNSLAFEEQRSKDCEEKLMAKNKELERSNQALEEMVEEKERIDEQITILQSELETNVNSLEIVKGKADVLEITVNDLQAELSAKTIEVKLVMDEAEIIRAENENLKKVCEKSEVFMEEHNITERKVQELEEKFFNEVKKTETYSFEIMQLKKELTEHQAKYEELLSDFNEVHLEKKSVEQKFENKSSDVKAIEADMKVSEKKAVKLSKEIQKLEEENQRLRAEICTIQSLHQRQCEEIETLQKKMEDSCEHLQKKVTQTERQLKAAEGKCSHLSKKIGSHLKAGEYQKEIKKLKSQITKELVKYSHLENKMSSLDEESRNQKRELEDKHQELLKELHDKSIIMQELQATAAEAIKSKEDAELKCQIKTADTVALMSKYERTVKEKDAELDEMKKRETMAVSFRMAAELDVTRLKTENSQLKKQLTTDKDNFQKKLSDQKKELPLLKSSQLSQDKNSTAKAFNTNEGESHVQTPRSTRSSKMNVFDFAEESGFGPMRMSGERSPKIKELRCKEIASPIKRTKRAGKEDKIKTYRIRTPPSATKPGIWGKGAIELQFDGSDPNNVLTFKNVPATHFSVPVAKCNPFQKSPTTVKPPGTSLKLAAVKRIRDAGWMAVNSSEKKKRSHANNFI